MIHLHHKHAAVRVFLALIPWLILALMLGATWLTSAHERQSSQNALRSQFDFALRETVSRIEQRVLGYEQMLRGVQSLFATIPLRNRSAMHNYVETLQLDANFAGVESIGVVEWVPAVDKEAHLANTRSGGFADYAISPDGVREFYAPIIGREPNLGRQFVPLGTDVWTDPMLRQTLEKARDSGMPAISEKISRTGAAGDVASAGFAMCLPIYEQSSGHDNVEQRRAQLIGWVYATFRMNDFMASLYGTQLPGLTLDIYNGADTSPASLLFHANGGTPLGEQGWQPAVSANEYMVVAGHNWTLSLSTQPAFETRYGRSTATLTAVAGTVLSLLLALLVWLMINGRNQALHLAARMTEELRHMAQHDPLTNLPNRALFNDRLTQALARAKRHQGRFAMLFLDLDHFKPINDKFGHNVGDQVLHRVARQLSTNVRAQTPWLAWVAMNSSCSSPSFANQMPCWRWPKSFIKR
jgi:CHASE1-domain containing sensor protein